MSRLTPRSRSDCGLHIARFLVRPPGHRLPVDDLITVPRTRRPADKDVLNVMASLAEWERELLVQLSSCCSSLRVLPER